MEPRTPCKANTPTTKLCPQLQRSQLLKWVKHPARPFTQEYTETNYSSQLYIAVRRILEQSQLRKKVYMGLLRRNQPTVCMVLVMLGQHSMARRLWWERDSSLDDSQGANKAQESQG